MYIICLDLICCAVYSVMRVHVLETCTYSQEAERLEKQRQAMAALREREQLAKLEQERRAREEERRMKEEEEQKVQCIWEGLG